MDGGNRIMSGELGRIMSVERQFGSGVAWMAAGNWIEQAINFAVFVALARILGAESLGLMGMAAAFVLMSEALVRESFSDFLIAADAPDAGQLNATFWMLAGFGTALTGLLLAFAGPIARLYGQPEVEALVRVLSLTVLMIALTAVPVALLRRALRFKVLSLRAVAGVLAGGLTGVGMALAGYGVWSLVAQRVVQVLVNIVLAWVVVGWRPGLEFRRADVVRVWSFGGRVLGLRAAELSATQLPAVLIGSVLGPVALGFFQLAWRIVEIGSFLIVTPLRLASQPAFAALRRSGAEPARLLMRISRLSGLVAIPAFVGLSVLAQPVVVLVFGPSWRGAAPVLAVLAMLGAYFCIEKIHQAFCLAAGRATATSVLGWVEVMLAVALAWLLRGWGVAGMAAGVVLAFYLLWPLRVHVVSRIAGLSLAQIMQTHILPLAGALLMALAVRGALMVLPQMRPMFNVISGTLAGLITFGLFAAIFMPDRLAILKTLLQRTRGADKA